jgi:hypothetical protein
MNRARVTDLVTAVAQFFETHPPAQRGISRRGTACATSRCWR